MKHIVEGVNRFKRDVYPEHRELFKKLASGQAPEVLMIACADSRVDPGLITQAKPGELFLCRNAGNIVPPHSQHTGGTTASIEFAVGALNVTDIVVCGHTDCGAMKGALNPEQLDAFPHVCNWLSHSKAAVEVVKENQPELEGKDRLNAVIKQNVIQQIHHLRTHPYVAARLSSGKARLHGWVYDIEHGEILAYDEARRDFFPISEAEAVASLHDHVA